ncbi:hypothetical protein GCM10027597_25880 [Saccharopolyspora tripterygii]
MTAVLDAIRVARPGRGRPSTRPKRVLVGKAYPSREPFLPVGTGSWRPSRSREIKPPTAAPAVRPEVGHPPSTPRPIDSATLWNAGSTVQIATIDIWLHDLAKITS